MAVDENKTLKILIHPTYEFDENKNSLLEFYEIEEKKIKVEMEDIFENSKEPLNRIQLNTEDPSPNFIIDGNILIFQDAVQNEKTEKMPKK